MSGWLTTVGIECRRWIHRALTMGRAAPRTASAAIDADVWFEDETHNEFFTPHAAKCPRFLQATVEGACTSFVENKSYNGLAAVPAFVPATFFYAAGINHGSSSTGAADGMGHYHADIDSIYEGTNVFWAVIQDDDVAASGSQTVTDGSIDVGTGLDADLVVIYSPGWTRRISRRFRYMVDGTAWLPDNGPPDMDDVSLPQDPPTSDDPGAWQTRSASTNYIEYGDDGTASGADDDSGRAFEEGDVAIWVGENVHDPTTTDSFEVNPERPNGFDPITRYVDDFWVGRWPDDVQADFDAMTS